MQVTRTRYLAVVTCLFAALCTQQVTAQVSASELGSIDFGSMLGGPLSAVVRAQASAARSTVNFINTVGFYDNRTAITVDFSYTSLNATSGEKVKTVLTIPKLAIVPVPFIRVASCDIAFNAKLTAVSASESSNFNSNSNSRSESRGQAWQPWITSSWSSSYSHQSSSKYSNREERQFSMKVRIQAKQDDMPAGMRKMLDILENAMSIS